MEIAAFIVFFLVVHFLLMQVFRLTTYHRYFWAALPLLVALSGLSAWVLYSAGLHQFFLWYLVLEFAWLVYIAKKQADPAKEMRKAYGGGAELINPLTLSVSRTKKYFKISSAIHLVAFSWVYLYLYNQ